MVKIQFDPWLVEAEAALWGLREYLEVVEEQIRYVDAQHRLRLKADLADRGADWEEALPELQELDMLVEHVFPRAFRAGFVMILWGTFEAGVAEIASGLASHLNAKLKLRDLRGDDFLDQASKYFDAFLGLELFSDPNHLLVLRDLLAVRNAFAHANGRLLAMNERTRAAVKNVIRKGGGVSDVWGDLCIDAGYCRQSFASVDECLRSIVKRARAVRRSSGATRS